ncbi:universal stress protein [Paraburkholderia sp. J12]|uniref:universal stress protein n=1 Tax=Paraburkholderia sp. J12 TaxID=2805432 RepID=UPI002ABE99B5|nr:universal stress protein [Paraburkholderia sp. J12]
MTGFKDILVHVDASAAGQVRLQRSAALAARHGARLNALYVRERSIAQQRRLKSSELGLVPGAQASSLRASIENELDAQADTLRARLDELGRENGIEVAWQAGDGRARFVVPQHARYADLTLVGHDKQEDADLPEEYSFAETVLFTTGRPVLIVPQDMAGEEVAPESLGALGRKVALAWNGSPSCARTLAAVLPLIECADWTTVLFIEGGEPARPEQLPPEAVLDHLRRHTGKVDLCTLAPTGTPMGDLLQGAALDQGADLLIAGAHGRPMLWEKLLGSVTRTLLTDMKLPLVMCG